ncbi:MAG: ACT domain-containing protein [Bacilli bacterium]|nr:ACT domain-containing protein [Bacilli bacterium]
MNSEKLLVDRKILPDFIDQVLDAKELIDGEGMSVSEACKRTGISRSTYYKYKDFVEIPPQNLTKKAILAFKLEDYPGVLSNVLTEIASNGVNILTINQDMPMHNLAFVSMMIDLSKAKETLKELVERAREVKHVKSVQVMNHD